MDWDDFTPLQQVDVVLVHGMLIGQVIFVVAWAVLPWWREWIGRALMVKSAALLFLILGALVNYWITIYADTPWVHWEQVMVGTHALVLIGIWSQVLALTYEKRRAKDDDNAVVGTAETRPPTHTEM